MEKRKAHNRIPINEPYIAEQYKAGRSLGAIGRELGVPKDIIFSRLKELKVIGSELEYDIPLRKNAGDPAFTKEERRQKWGQFGSDRPLWKGGVTALNEYLRKSSHDWRDAKMAQANYKCWITGEEAPRLNVHHAEPWHLLRDEAMRKAGIYGLEFVGDCAPEQLEECYEILTQIHRTLNGYVLDERLHVLFHSVYGYKVSDADIHEFKARYLSGEFK